MKKNLFKGISFTVGASLWWGIIGVVYFKFVSYASPLELTIHRTIWTALLLVITTTYYSKWEEFNKIIKFISYINCKICYICNGVFFSSFDGIVKVWQQKNN